MPACRLCQAVIHLLLRVSVIEETPLAADLFRSLKLHICQGALHWQLTFPAFSVSASSGYSPTAAAATDELLLRRTILLTLRVLHCYRVQ